MASISFDKIEQIVRNIISDRVVAGETPLFSESEVVDALNIAKSSIYGRKPEAFLVESTDTGINLSEPSDYTASSTLSLASWAVEPLTFMVAYLLLSQKSKDNFHREAATQLREFYERAF